MQIIRPHFDLISSPGAVCAGYHSRDWSSTALGHPDTWPTLLRNSVSLMLDSQFPMFVVWGKELAFLYNAPYVPLLDAKHPAALGSPLKHVWPELWAGVQPLVASALAGKPTFGKDIFRTIRRDGRDQPAWFTLSYSPIRDDNGFVPGALCVIDETTERVGLERRQALQLELVDKLRPLSCPKRIMEAASELLGRFLDVPYVSCAEIDEAHRTFQVKGEWARDNGGIHVRPSGRLDDYGLEAISILHSGQPLATDDIRSDGRTAGYCQAYAALGVRSLLALPRVQGGRAIAVLNLCHSEPRHWSEEDIQLAADILERTWSAVERVRAEEALRQVSRRKDEFLAMLAHELRNPLAPISVAAQLLKMTTLEPDRIRQTSDIIARQVEHLTGLIDDLLDVARVTTGLVLLNKEEVDIKHVITDAVEQVRPLIEARRHHFLMHITPDATFVDGDYKRLVQIVANLLNNAAKYTPEGKKVMVGLEATEEQVILRISDTGIGISQELLPTIFELFSQAERTSDRSQGGLGLGLALVKSLVELHSGSVSAVSDGQDAGSEFTIRLPRLENQPAQAPSPDFGTALDMSASVGPLHLLVVDDNVNAAQMLTMFLETAGCRVSMVHAPGDALALAAHQAFDAFLLDVGLPGMDGYELARSLRAMPQARTALFIAITGYGQQFDRKTGMQAGFDHYLVKPANPLKILDLLSKITAS